MTRYYEGLPIYRSTADVAVALDKVGRGFPRYHKYSLGTDLRRTATDLVVLVARCNRREDRPRLPGLVPGVNVRISRRKQ